MPEFAESDTNADRPAKLGKEKTPRFRGVRKNSSSRIEWTIQDSNCSDVTDVGEPVLEETRQLSSACVALGATNDSKKWHVDPQLQLLIDTWQTLSPDARDTILQVAGVSDGTGMLTKEVTVQGSARTVEEVTQ